MVWMFFSWSYSVDVLIHISFGENVTWIGYKQICPYVAPATTFCFPQAWVITKLVRLAKKENFQSRPKAVARGREGHRELCPSRVGGTPVPRERSPPAPHTGVTFLNQEPGLFPRLPSSHGLQWERHRALLVYKWCTNTSWSALMGFREAHEVPPVKQCCVWSCHRAFRHFPFGSLTWVRDSGPATATSPRHAGHLLPDARRGTGRVPAGQALVLTGDAGCTCICYTLKHE